MSELICSIIKKSSRYNRRKIKRTGDCGGFPLDKNGSKRRSEEYICMDAKTCLAEVDGEKLPEFPRNRFNKLNGNRKSQVDPVLSKTEAKHPSSKNTTSGAKVKRDIIAENITKQGKKLHVNTAKRIPATSNFVYEFNPFANAEQSRPLTLIHSWHTSNPEQTLPYFTDTTSFDKSALNHNDLARRKSSATLPQLNSRTDSATIDPDANVTDSSPTRNTCLPLLSKEDPTKILNNYIDKDEQSDIDREVENAKSAWQVLRGEKHWTKGKDRIGNAGAKNLYEMLEKMTCEIDRVQRSYMDPKANQYLCRSATNVHRTDSKPTLQEEAEIVRSVIFPDRKARTAKSAVSLRNVDSEIIGKDTRVRFDGAAENILTDKQPRENFASSKRTAKKRSVHTDAYGHDIANDARSVHASDTWNGKRDTAISDMVKPTFTDGSKTRARIKSSIEEYLRRYSDNIHKSRGIEEEERTRDVRSSAGDIANILASHNIGSHVLYENFEGHSDGHDSDDYASEDDEERSCSSILNAPNVARVTMSVDTIQENKKTRNNTSFENAGSHDTRLTKAIDARSFDTRRRSNATNCQDNAFVRMGLNENLPRDTLSQILQSEYLRKDLSL